MVWDPAKCRDGRMKGRHEENGTGDWERKKFNEVRWGGGGGAETRGNGDWWDWTDSTGGRERR